MSTMQGNADNSVKFLNAYFDTMGSPNTLYTEEAEPVIETPLLTAVSIMHMVMMAYNGQINIFNGIPKTSEWEDVEFAGLRADGGFVVSARKKDGTVQRVKVTSLAGELCRISADFLGDVKVKGNREFELTAVWKNVYGIDLQAGETAILYTGESVHEEVEPVAYKIYSDKHWGL